jgi:hypothetical protein
VSDLQDLIHTNAHNAYEIGVRTERERIIKELQSKRCECLTLANDELMALIRRDDRLSHMSCEWTFLDAVVKLIEEQK